jgi:hypothetical protein
MKNTIKVLGIIALAAVIGFGVVSCDDGGGSSPSKDPIPKAADYDISGMSCYLLKYGELLNPSNYAAPVIQAKQGKSGGAVTLYYKGILSTTYTKSAVLPTVAGTYAVTFDVAAAEGWQAASGLEAGTFLINDILVTGVSTGERTLKAWLAAQADNTAAAPYYISIAYSQGDVFISAVCDVLKMYPNKYVSLHDLFYNTNYGAPPDDFDFFASISSFKDCTNLVGITIPKEMNITGNLTFYGCTSLKDVIMPDHIKSIGDSTFMGCTGLESITIGNSVTSIGDNAFNDCSSLKNVTIGSGVISIGDSAFWDCTSLKSITIPANVKSIGRDAFSGAGIESITIPNSVTSIGANVFKYCNSLKSLTIDTTTIDEDYGLDTTGLESVTIGNSVKSIEGIGFFECTTLKNVTIGNSVESIGFGVFLSCTSLSSITIPASVKSIVVGAFYRTGLTSVTFAGTIPSGGFAQDFTFDYEDDEVFEEGEVISVFPGDLRAKFYASNASNGTPGRYTRPNTSSTTWTKQ